ncbi:MAG: bifunctional hydroxymethylpyrimidine kinase/phosphomethylpyrimidine kinase [Candidatus Neomarinimicrobiota bacterium]|jgi:hydroxymethylpyrimidine/phosphomethylpyrimidine kinase
MKKYKRVLTIAGSDSGGGAGIQADLKTFSALGCFGMSVITALTAQNTTAVTGIYPVPADFVAKQIDAVMSDIGVDALKIGMLNTPDIIINIANKLKEYKVKNIVLDPVMIAKSGDKLLRDESIKALKEELIPLARLITPNIPEAEVLACASIKNREDLEKVAKKLLELGPEAVLVKGGHFENAESPDCLVLQSGEVLWLEAKRINSPNTHGTGCTTSSAIAAYLAQGLELGDAVRSAKKYIQSAIIAGAEYKIGHGHGPVHHFHELWEE